MNVTTKQFQIYTPVEELLIRHLTQAQEMLDDPGLAERSVGLGVRADIKRVLKTLEAMREQYVKATSAALASKE